MAAIVFPSSPSVGDVFFDNGVGYQWDGVAWLTYKPTTSANHDITSLDLGSSTVIQAKFVMSSTLRDAQNRRVVTYPNASTLTPNPDTTDVGNLFYTGAGTLTVAAPTGEPYDGQQLMLRIRSTNSVTITWNAIYAGSLDMALITFTSGGGLWDHFGFIYNAYASKWHLIAQITGF